MRDIFLRLGINQLFGYRSWDFVPDVMLFTRTPGIEFGEFETKGPDGKLGIVVNKSDGLASSSERPLSDGRCGRPVGALRRHGFEGIVTPCAAVPGFAPPSKPDAGAPAGRGVR